jgi:hypothetical protein
MSLDKILAISGKPGLYELKAQTKAGFLAESLVDGKKLSVGMRHNVSVLNEIAIYTYAEEVPLNQIFNNIKEKENGGESISHKVPKAELEKYFSEILPEYDEDRVYASDMKKVIQWYNLLHKRGIVNFDRVTDSTSEEE